MMRFAAMAAVALVSLSALADTIYLKSGVRVDGQVLERTESGLRLKTGNRETFVPHASVARVEENDKTGGIDVGRLRQEAEERLKLLERKTGLTATQRDQVEEAVAMLVSESAAERSVALERLKAMNEGLPVFDYLAKGLSEYMPWHAVGIMTALVEMDGEAAPAVLRTQTRRHSGACRAKALELLGVCGDTRSADLMVRGLVDHDYPVRAAAAKALGDLRLKSATPPLLDALSSGDQRVRQAALDALSRIWSGDNASFADAAGWESFWMSKRAATPSPYAGKTLEPLVPPGTYFQDE